MPTAIQRDRSTPTSFALILAALLTVTCRSLNAQILAEDPPLLGTQAPDLTDLEWIGKVTPAPDALKGKVVILDFWATWCAPCVAGLPAMNELAERYRDSGVVVVAVNYDEKREKVEAFLRKNAMEPYVGIDRGQEKVKAFGIGSIPHGVLIDREGVIRWSGRSEFLTPEFVSHFLSSGKPVPEKSEEERTMISLSVREAMTSETGLLSFDNGEVFGASAIAYAPEGVIENFTTLMLNGNREVRVINVPARRRLYSVELNIGPSLDPEAMWEKVIGQLDAVFGTRTHLATEKKMVYALRRGDEALLARARHDSNVEPTAEVKDGAVKWSGVEPYRIASYLKANYGIIVPNEFEAERGELYDVTIPEAGEGRLDETLRALERAGFALTKEERDVEFLVIEYLSDTK